MSKSIYVDGIIYGPNNAGMMKFNVMVSNDKIGKTLSINDGVTQFTIPFEPVLDAMVAEWVPQPEKGDCIYKCSNCGYIRDAYVLEIDNCCPNCGSKTTEGGSRMGYENFPFKVTGVYIDGKEVEFFNECSDKQEGEAMTREEVLDKAKECVCTDREGQYGRPEDNFSLIAMFWNAYLESRHTEIEYSSVIEAGDVAVMMALFKIARIATGKPKADNFIDLAGYAACGAEIHTKGLE